MTSLEVFVWGCSGSLAVDVIAFAKHFESKRKLPHYYHRVAYYVLRFLIASIAGGLALAYGIQKELLAFHIGAAAPLLIVAASQGLNGQGGRIAKE